jgi:hypothetical protein
MTSREERRLIDIARDLSAYNLPWTAQDEADYRWRCDEGNARMDAAIARYQTERARITAQYKEN